MALINDLTTLPDDLPRPQDDGACRHLHGMVVPSIALESTDGTLLNLGTLRGRTVLFAYPRTGQPGLPALSDIWNEIPGARGCTPQTCGYRDLHSRFLHAGYRVIGLSTQSPAYQQEMVRRLNVNFQVVSDSRLELCRALSLPTFTVAGQELLKRLTLIVHDGVIIKVFYPVFPPDRNASTVLDWIGKGC